MLGSIGKAIGSIGKAAGSLGSVVGLGQSLGLIGQPAVGEGINPYKHMKHGIRWRVEDAKRAGVHPLAALGASIGGPIASPVRSSRPDLPGALSDVGANLAQYDREAQKRAESREAREHESRIRVNETQALLNEARSRSLMSEVRANPTITAQVLDPSYVTNPSTGRLAMFKGADGNWHRVDQSMAPQHVLEEEFGEVGELHALGRLARGAYEYGGAANWPSLSEIISKGLRHWPSNP